MNTLLVFTQSTVLEHGNLKKVICLLYLVIQLNMVWDLSIIWVYASGTLCQLKFENLLHFQFSRKIWKIFFQLHIKLNIYERSYDFVFPLPRFLLLESILLIWFSTYILYHLDVLIYWNCISYYILCSTFTYKRIMINKFSHDELYFFNVQV